VPTQEGIFFGNTDMHFLNYFNTKTAFKGILLIDILISASNKNSRPNLAYQFYTAFERDLEIYM
jgi:hypothetical protein